MVSICALMAYPWLSPPGRDVAFLIVAWGTLLPVMLTLRHTPRADRAPWWLLWSALALGGLTSSIRRWPGLGDDIPQFLPVLGTVANALLLAAALAVVIRRGRNDIGGLIDTTIVSLALGGLLWNVIILPRLEAGGQSLSAKASLFATVVLLSGVFGALARLLETGSEHVRALRVLMAALALNLAGVVLIAAWNEPGARLAAQMMFLAAYICLGMFGIDTTAAKLATPSSPPLDSLGPRRLIYLGTALAAVPLWAGGRVLLGHPVDGLFLAVCGAVMAPLVMLRIGRLAAERNRTEEALRYLAAHDPLTGALNRREFTSRLAAELREPNDCALVFFDLNGFKEINDRLGHPAGDRLLIEVARRVLDCVRENDFVGRFGGDEFLVLFRNAGQPEMQHLCARIRDVLSEPFVHDGDTLMIGVSMGAVLSEAGHRDPCVVEELIRKADEAMYGVKRPQPTIDDVDHGRALPHPAGP
ncbi:MAG TPA: hypothetical protein DGG94_17280 [Micromonosporaceae bacterium]|nr:hypothetical protein [Micromonosporaceae bacterium]